MNSAVQPVFGVEWAPVSQYLVRGICNPLPPEVPPRVHSFMIFAGPVEQPDDSPHSTVALVGEVQTVNLAESHLLAATTVLSLAFDGKGPDLTDDETYRSFLARAGAWGSHLLWDFTAGQLRKMASGLLHSELDLPLLTPEPVYLTANGHDPLDDSAPKAPPS